MLFSMDTGRTSCPAKSTYAGFTLVELLVVVAIMTVLATLMFPAVQGGLERARTAACLQNLRSLGMAFNLYAADHNGWMPTGGIQQSSLVPELLTYMGIKTKTKASSAWICPADRKIQDRAKLVGFTSNPDERYYYSYGFVEAFVPACSTTPSCSTIYTQTNQFPILSSVINRPKSAVFLSDGGYYRIVNNSVTFKHQRVQFRHGRPAALDGMEVETVDAYWRSLGYDIHGEFKNALANLFFYDGHAESRTYTSYAELLNRFITSGYSDRPGLTPIPASEL